MAKGVPFSEYKALLTLGESAMWQWPKRQFHEAALPGVRKSLDQLPYTFMFGDGFRYANRPYGIMLIRLLLELGELTIQRDQDGAAVHLAKAFQGADGLVPLSLSTGAPWGVNEAAPGEVDEFLQVAQVNGDAIYSREPYMGHERKPTGLAIHRNLRLFLISEVGNGNLAFEAGFYADETGYDLPEEWAPLQFAGLEGGRLTVVSCGMPRFGAFDPKGMRVVRPPFPIPGFPRTYEFETEDGSTERCWVPLSEDAAGVSLHGYAFEENPERAQICRALGDEGDPVIRVHLSYVPGWRSSMDGSARVWCWSECSDEYREHIESLATEVVSA